MLYRKASPAPRRFLLSIVTGAAGLTTVGVVACGSESGSVAIAPTDASDEGQAPATSSSGGGGPVGIIIMPLPDGGDEASDGCDGEMCAVADSGQDTGTLCGGGACGLVIMADAGHDGGGDAAFCCGAVAIPPDAGDQ